VDEAVQVLSPEELQTDFESKQKQIFEAAVANSTKVATLLALAASFDASGSASSDADINLKSKRKRIINSFSRIPPNLLVIHLSKPR